MTAEEEEYASTTFEISVLCMAQITRQGTNYTAASFMTIVEKEQTLVVRLIPDSDAIVGQ